MRRRVKLLAPFAAAAVLIHWVVLGGLQWTWTQRAPLPVAPPPAVQVLAAEAPPSEPAAAAVPAAPPVLAAATPTPTPTPTVPAKAGAGRKQAAAPVRPRAIAPVTAPAPAEAAPDTLPADAVLALNVAAAPTSAGPSAAPAPAREGPAAFPDETIPHYRTQAPPATRLRYDLQRGVLHGSGELLWRPDGAHYELRLDGRVGPLSVLTQVSSGGFDAAGLAPLRFTDKRLRRSMAATNFQREAGKITFSGPSAEFPLPAGMQDRLSWMVQLAAIVAAEPALRVAGARVLMGVVGVNADPAVWNFRGVGREAVETGAGTVTDALKFVRDPHDLHDTTVQVWLDPQRHYLPIHATQKSGPSDDEFSLRLLESSPVP